MPVLVVAFFIIGNLFIVPKSVQKKMDGIWKRMKKEAKMKIREYLEYLDKEWDGVDNREVLRPLMEVLSPVSQQTMREFQAKTIPETNGDFKAFVAAQNKELKQCIELEMHGIGIIVRENFGLYPLMLDTEVQTG